MPELQEKCARKDNEFQALNSHYRYKEGFWAEEKKRLEESNKIVEDRYHKSLNEICEVRQELGIAQGMLKRELERQAESRSYWNSTNGSPSGDGHGSGKGKGKIKGGNSGPEGGKGKGGDKGK
eukprot:gnl/TRDRNA2_/TRDRNA2_125233_c2_seq1.p1 gnl/TRDRNA2_/TRDRNA2_125233_c2~~gnl/TRDRNA2_/TRDRNA2_125233_c2_seq1.p1  ORF type:complete len:123 (+),score=32.34 gnl/TRDRNA2_/TRDRNA2_125233_c2_seq1:97-465(+)